MHRNGEQVAERADVGLARDGVAGQGRDRKGQKQGEFDVQRREGDEDPVRRRSGEEVRPPTGSRLRHLERDGDHDGNGREHEQSCLIASTSDDEVQFRAQQPQGGRAETGTVGPLGGLNEVSG